MFFPAISTIDGRKLLQKTASSENGVSPLTNTVRINWETSRVTKCSLTPDLCGKDVSVNDMT